MARRRLTWQERRFALGMARNLISEGLAVLWAAVTGRVARSRHGWKESKT